MKITEELKKKHILIDGAMGTMLQARGLPIGMQPEYFNITHPHIVTDIHKEYVAAGADVITANTFQANSTKIPQEQLPEIIRQGILIAKAANPRYVAMNIGPIGQLMQPMGTLSFDNAYEMFRQQAVIAEEAGADLVIIETMSDLLETKAAILAIKENSSLPIFCTMTFQEDGRTFVGSDPVSATLTLQGLGVDALGVNCSLGPQELLPVVGKILEYAKVPVMVQANAGLPEMENGQTVYRLSIEEYTKTVAKMIDAGVRVLGGCCGTNPRFTQSLRTLLDKSTIKPINPKIVTAVCSGSQTVILDNRLSIIGERINPTGKKRLQEALRKPDLAYIMKEAIMQTDAGADILDVNVGLPEIDEGAMMIKVVQELQSIVNLPLQIDSSDPNALEKGARYYNGSPLLNSVNGKKESMETVFPIVKKYGCSVLGLALNKEGIPNTAEGRYKIAETIVNTAKEYGIPKEKILIDPLVLTASAQQEQAMVTIETIRLVKNRLGVKTVIGLSNVSFGLPNRALLNGSFLAAAVGAGLDAPILNPLSAYMMDVVSALKVFNYQDKDSIAYIDRNKDQTISSQSKEGSKTIETKTSEENLSQMILKGQKSEAAAKTKELLKTLSPLEIVDQFFIPALNEVGQQFAKGVLFLPQLMQSAEATKQSQEVLKEYFLNSERKEEAKEKILIATVEGDIHDIGKNIVKMILENYGFDVLDLGKDVPIQQVVEQVRTHDVKLIALSALMTTTVQNMKKTIAAVREAGLEVSCMVGGAVLNEEYKEFVGAEYYAKDAMESVEIAKRFFKMS